MLGTVLEDPHLKEGPEINNRTLIKGIGLLPLKTKFLKNKKTRQIKSESLWPSLSKINGFEIHNGKSELDKSQNTSQIKPLFKDIELGWYLDNNKSGTVAGTYIHGIFENDIWRDNYINFIKKKKKFPTMPNKSRSYKIKREAIINNLANEFDKHLNISALLN